jgi:hypothetical protein
MFKRDWTAFSNVNNYSTFDSEHNREDPCIQLINHKHAIMIIITKSWEVRFQYFFGSCFIVDLLMQREFCCVNRIGRSWSTHKMNQVTPTYLGIVVFSFYNIWKYVMRISQSLTPIGGERGDHHIRVYLHEIILTQRLVFEVDLTHELVVKILN